MQRRMEQEGDPYSKIFQLMQEAGYSKPVNIELATVVADPPDIKIKLDSDGLVLEKTDLIIADRLTSHKRIVSIRKHPDEPTRIDFNSTNITDNMTKEEWHTHDEEGVGVHSHDILSLGMHDVQDSFTFERAELTYEDALKVGERVIIVCLDEDMVYVVLDRAAWYT